MLSIEALSTSKPMPRPRSVPTRLEPKPALSLAPRQCRESTQLVHLFNMEVTIQEVRGTLHGMGDAISQAIGTITDNALGNIVNP